MNQADLDCITLKSNEDKYDTDFPAILDMEIVRRNALDAIASNERIQAYAQFEIYARSRETLTDTEIKELIGFKPIRSGYKYERYRFIRYSKIDVIGKNGKLEKQSTWLIEKFDPIAEAKLKKAAQEKRKLKEAEHAEYLNLEILNLDDFEIDEGLENHRNMKIVMAEV
jgi:hypothetical protein